MKSEENSQAAKQQWLSGSEIFALSFGFLLGLAIVKLGNPVILDSAVEPPHSSSEFLHDLWPTRWAIWLLLPFLFFGSAIVVWQKPCWPVSKWLWLLPIAWLTWQCVSATRTVDASLTRATLIHFFGCVGCYFIGAFVLRGREMLRWMLPGLLAGFAFCCVRAVQQHVIEFPREQQMLIEGERTGWTNFPPAVLDEMRREKVVISTNGVERANPLFLAKYEKGRVHGTLFYPNTLAGAVLLLFPMSLAAVWAATRRMKNSVRLLAFALMLFLGTAALLWSGSKAGWLIAMGLCLVALWRYEKFKRFKSVLLVAIAAVGLTVFAIRFHQYLARGATSAVARLDYWRVAARVAGAHPLFGSGPGTFQRPYEQLKSPESEMARLTHNDYLEQFSDSGFPGGIIFAFWILLFLWTVSRAVMKTDDRLAWMIFLGVLGWLAQETVEFGLYIPALAWTACALGGALLQVSQKMTDMRQHSISGNGAGQS